MHNLYMLVFFVNNYSMTYMVDFVTRNGNKFDSSLISEYSVNLKFTFQYLIFRLNLRQFFTCTLDEYELNLA